ncbi:P-loop containing nucleoside triphosphate hydrolase protein [Sporodiniella umbellata]|nr:P-loop containing nucleoside triphosphate hydrolase protein [Sporodiniella umbellata]
MTESIDTTDSLSTAKGEPTVLPKVETLEDRLVLEEITDAKNREQTDQKTPKEEEKKKKKKLPAVPIYKMFRFATNLERLMIVIAVFFSASIGAMMPVSTIMFGRLIGTLGKSIASGSYSSLATDAHSIVLIYVYMGIGVMIAAYIAQCFWVLTGENQVRRIRTMYVHAILRQDMAWFDKAEEGSLTTRLAADTQLVQDGISEKFGLFVMCIGQFTAGIIIAFAKGWRLAIVILAVLPILVGSGTSLGYFITKYTLKAQGSYAEAGSVAEQVFSGIRTTYSFSLQNRFAKLYDERLEKAKKTGVLRGRVLGLGFGTVMFTLFCTYGISFWYGTKLAREKVMEGSDVSTVYFAMIIGAMSLLNLPPNLSAVSSGRGAAYKIFATIDRVPEIDCDNPKGLKPETFSSEIEFKNVLFKYPTRPDITILRNLNLKIRPGMTVAFVGPSGSGKSTSIQLIQRFYDPVQGSVMLDGHDLVDYNVSWLRSKIGVVSQEPVLFNMTIKQNLLMGVDGQVSNDDIVEACKKANCHSFISQLTKGYETLVGEHGGMLSGGQKQRIAIARAILKNPPILLLDEATSALDTQSERLVQSALDAASADRTTIVIAHRLSTIRNADLIVVMQQGDVVEQGTHNELLALNGTYYELVKKQEIATQKTGHIAEEIDPEELLKREEMEVAHEKSQAKNMVMDEKEIDKSLFRTTTGTSSVDLYTEKLKKEKESRKDVKKMSIPMKKVLLQMRPEWPLLAVGVFGSCIAGTLFPCYSLISSRVVSQLASPSTEEPGPLSGTNLYSFLFFVIGICAFCGYSLQVLSFEIAGECYTKRLRSSIFRALMRQEVGYFDQDNNSLGSLTAKLAVDSKNVNELITKTWGDATQLVVTAITGLSIAFSQSWKLTLVILCMTPFVIFATSYESRVHRGYQNQTKKANEQSGDVAGEAIKEVRTVATLNKQGYFESKYVRATDHPHRLAQRKAYFSSVGYALNQGIILFTNAVAFYAGTHFISQGIITYQDMFTCMMTIMVTAQGIGRTSAFTAIISKAKFSAISAFEILERQPLIDPDLEGIEPSYNQVKGDISFKNVSFRYPARPDIAVFDGEFNMTGKKGQTIALVGPSGCGKSTTIGMLQRWYDVASGVVALDETNVKNYSLNNLRSHMALVGQEPVLFDISIGENVRFGIDEGQKVSQEQVEAACRAANIHKFIVSLPEGYDTRVGDKGSQLSGGQKQRIAIARALIRKPKVLLLDEATSALDSESEKLVQTAIDNILQEGGRTTITIAHRLSTIQNADLICVVKDGRVTEQGTHWELLELGGVYSDLVYQQSLNAH